MIMLEIFLFFLTTLFFIYSISGIGKIFTHNFESSFLTNVFFGFIFLGIYSTFLHFFFKINLFNSFIPFLFGIMIQFYPKKIHLKSIFNKNFSLRLVVILLLIPIFLSQKYHEDFGYYHLPYSLSFIEEKIIFGFANINYAYIYNSIWLNISSLFFLKNQNFNFLTFHSFILYIAFVLFLFEEIFYNKKNSLSKIFSIFILFYFLVKFTRISEFGVDLPAAIFSILSILFFIKFYENNNLKKKFSYFFFNFSFSIFAVLIKLSVLPILLLTFYLFLKNYKKKISFFVKSNFLLINILVILYFFQQFIYTGCFAFPSNLTCLNVSWLNESFLNYKNNLELINKSYSTASNVYSPEDYLKNFTWFSYWFKRNFNEILEHLIAMILPFMLFISLNKKSEKNLNFGFGHYKIFYIFCLINLFFWLKFSPVYRFSIHLFLLISFLLIFNFFYQKNISKKIFVIFTFVIILFNFGKNLNRINNKEQVFLGIEKINNNFKLINSNKNLKIKIFSPDIKNNTHNGWQGRLCWDIPFICSYNQVELQRKFNYLIISKSKNDR